MTPAKVHLHVASAGNEVMAHIAGLFAEGIALDGVASKVIVDGLPLADREVGALSVVVAPHEFFPLHFLRTRPTIELEPTLASVAVFNVEQPGSQWFEVGWEFARRARHVFDISPAGVAEFHRRGVIAVHTPLGYLPSLEAPAPRLRSDRQVDVLFLGHASPRRNAFFARHADFFSTFNCHLVFSELDRPRLSTTPGYRSGVERLNMVASSRILLCVHSTERPYFEQHRAMLALANGCLLVTESSQHTAPLQDGVHFASAELDALPALCRRFLTDPSALDTVASAGREMAMAHMPLRRSSAIVLDALQRPAACDIERRGRRQGSGGVPATPGRQSGSRGRWRDTLDHHRQSLVRRGTITQRHGARHAVQLPAAHRSVPGQRDGSDAASRRSRNRDRRRRVDGRRRRFGGARDGSDIGADVAGAEGTQHRPCRCAQHGTLAVTRPAGLCPRRRQLDLPAVPGRAAGRP